MKAPAVHGRAAELIARLRAAGDTEAADVVAGLLGSAKVQLAMLTYLEKSVGVHAVQLAQVRVS